MLNNQPYPHIAKGKLLVIGIDVGTTLSGVSYVLLEPGKVPRIQPVTSYRFSGQRAENGKSKIHSVVCYDQDGNVITAGSETELEGNSMLPETEGVRRAECFKLHLWQTRLAADKTCLHEKIWPPLVLVEDGSENDVPPGIERAGGGKLEGSGGKGGSEEEVSQVVERQHTNMRKVPRPVTDDFKTPVRVFTDLLQYLFKSAKEYITKTERNLDTTFTWSSIESNTYFVLTHPNRWGGKQQSQMREAAIAAGLVNRATVANRITFVTEGEAGLHFCLDKNPELRQERGGLLVVDCGGGTIDLSAYSQIKKGRYKEIVSPYSLRQGSIFVTSRARDYFKEKFKNSRFGSDDIVETMARAFDKPEGIKCMFRYPNRPYFVKFGGLRENNQRYGVLGGKFKVEGAQMAKFFEPAIQGIINGIESQCRNTKDGMSIKCVLLIGGFGRSQYLYQRLSEHFNDSGIAIIRPDITHLNKAVADGAVSWYLDRYVSTNFMTRHLFDLTDPDHLNRESAGNRGQAACVKQTFTLRRPTVHACNNGQKLPGTTRATKGRHDKPAASDSTSQVRKRGNHWQERRDTGEIGTRPQDSDRQSRNGCTERLNVEEACLNSYRRHTTGGKDCHGSTKGEQLRKLPPSTDKSGSVADAVELDRMLNAQGGQSGFIPNSPSYRNPSISGKELEEVLEEFASYIGSSLYHDLRSQLSDPNIGPDRLLTKVALRSGLAKACSYILNNEVPPFDGATLLMAGGHSYNDESRPIKYARKIKTTETPRTVLLTS